MKRWILYVLELEHDKWYVGVTTDVKRQVYIHERGKASKWTRKYRPKKLHYVQDLGKMSNRRAHYYELSALQLYGQKYGKKNVHGGDLALAYRSVNVFGRRFRMTDWETIVVLSVVGTGAAYLILDKLKLLPW